MPRVVIAVTDSIMPVTIPGGLSVSEAVMMGGMRLFGWVMPAAWDAAAVTVLASIDGGVTFVPMKSLYDGTEITYVVNAGAYFPLPNIAIMAGVTHLKLQSGTTAAPVVQTVARTIQLVLRSI